MSSDLPKVTQLMSKGGRIQTQSYIYHEEQQASYFSIHLFI